MCSLIMTKKTAWNFAYIKSADYEHENALRNCEASKCGIKNCKPVNSKDRDLLKLV